ncbi:hypothetical protein JHU04_001100 [Brenneria sp. 4F2]|nr:hypothetical protein [Brenneria bubanii]
MKIERSNALTLLQNRGEKFIYPLKMGGDINSEAFDDLLLVAEEITRIFKYDELIPKRLLLELHLLSVGIECENYHFNNDALAEMSQKILRCYQLLIDGKSVDDLLPHGPRIL